MGWALIGSLTKYMQICANRRWGFGWDFIFQKIPPNLIFQKNKVMQITCHGNQARTIKLSLAFTPITSFSGIPQSKWILLNISMKCETQHIMHKFENNSNSSCTGRSSENIWIYVAANGGAQEKRKRTWNSIYNQNWWKN
jgi:hypothetical protein